MTPSSELRAVLDLARWAPSGDNVQSHEFEIAGPHHVVVHAVDTRADTVYDLDGHPSQIAFGALLETMAIAATQFGWGTQVVRRPSVSADDPHVVFDVRFDPVAGLAPDPLLPFVPERSVQRRPLSTRPLSEQQKLALTASVGKDYRLSWLETAGERLRAARLMYNNAQLRLTMPEAYEVHKRIIHWGVKRSPDRVPDQALGVDVMTVKLMRWAMVSWQRLSRVNGLMGTWAPRLQMDFLPGMACAAHFVLRASRDPESIDDYVAAGRAVQRFWLTATQLGLQLQPELTPLIFSRYVREGRPFTRVPALRELAVRLERQSAALLGDEPGVVFMGRTGAGPAASARSERKPLESLIRRP